MGAPMDLQVRKQVKKRLSLKPIATNSIGEITALAITLDHSRGQNLYRNSVETPDFHPNQEEEEWYMPHGGSSQGDHIFSHATQMDMIARILKVNSKTDLTFPKLHKIFSKTLHSNMVRWLAINYAFWKSWENLVQAPFLQKKIDNCKNYGQSLIQVYQEFCKRMEHSSFYGIHENGIELQKKAHLDLLKLAECYLNIYLEAYFNLILGVARKVGPFNQYSSLIEGRARKKANQLIQSGNFIAVSLATLKEAEINQTIEFLRKNGHRDLLSVFRAISLLIQTDQPQKAKELCSTLSGVIDPDAFAVMFFKQASTENKPFVIAHFILQLWLFFESMGWTDLSVIDFLDRYKCPLSQPLIAGNPFSGFIFTLVELLDVAEFSHIYKLESFKTSLQKAIDYLSHQNLDRALPESFTGKKRKQM